MSKRPPASHVEPFAGRIVLRVAKMARQRGMVNTSGRWHGYPHLEAIRAGTGLSYQALFTMLRRPDRVQRIDLATLERLCASFHCEPGDLLRVDWQMQPHPRQHTETVNPLSKAWQATRPQWERIVRPKIGGQRPRVPYALWPRESTGRVRERAAERRGQDALRSDW